MDEHFTLTCLVANESVEMRRRTESMVSVSTGATLVTGNLKLNDTH